MDRKGKRPLEAVDDDRDVESNKRPTERKVRFPKGKKAKKGEGGPSGDEEGLDAFGSWMNPDHAARERAIRRSRNRERDVLGEEENSGALKEIVAHSEVIYQESTSLDVDGIQLEPFNLDQEREEGYFDAQGNFVEYAKKDEIKDAWLDSIDVEPKFAGKNHERIAKEEEEEDYQDLSSSDIGRIKRSIANILQPGETVIQALKRLKGPSSGKKDKMSEDTKHLFDQLTENAMKLMENGEYNVYHETRETFDREAGGYEHVARAMDSISNGNNENTGFGDVYSVLDMPTQAGTDASAQLSPADGGTEYDMFGDDDENTDVNPNSSVASEMLPSPASENFEASTSPNTEKATIGNGTDYVYDDSSGYYYSSNLGYYYDPQSGMYCSATSGQWYTFNEQTGEYDEVQSTTQVPN